MEADEIATVQAMESYRETVASLIKQHNGMVIDSPGDNLLSELAGESAPYREHAAEARVSEAPMNGVVSYQRRRWPKQHPIPVKKETAHTGEGVRKRVGARGQDLGR